MLQLDVLRQRVFAYHWPVHVVVHPVRDATGRRNLCTVHIVGEPALLSLFAAAVSCLVELAAASSAQ